METVDICRKQLRCGHRCHGLRGERVCLPCLSCNNGDTTQTTNDMCMICYTEELPAAPCIQLTCSHIFHLDCVKMMLMRRWSGPKISFACMVCPICKYPVDHPSLKEELEPIKAIYDDVRSKALERLHFEGIHQSDDGMDHSGNYHDSPATFAMERYAYYACSKCGKAYYGGENRCEQNNGDNFNPDDLVCGACVDFSRMQECPSHGTDYIEFKCRYCCSVAVYYCFGTTHFCNNCHNNHYTLTSMPQTELPSCPAGPVGQKLSGTKCPLGLKEHPPTGDEFSLGCRLCYNLRNF